MGTVTTGAGRRFTGRLVYDLDESETTETLDAPSQGVNYTIPFGMISSIVFGDLGEGSAGMLIFVDGRERTEYVRWTDMGQVDFDRPPATYPPLGKR